MPWAVYSLSLSLSLLGLVIHHSLLAWADLATASGQAMFWLSLPLSLNVFCSSIVHHALGLRVSVHEWADLASTPTTNYWPHTSS